MAHDGIKELRRRVHLLLEQGPVGDGVGRWIERLLVALILVNLVAVALEFEFRNSARVMRSSST